MIHEFLVKYARFGSLFLLIGLVLAAAYFFSAVLLPFVLAVFLSYLISPLVNRLTQLELGRIRIRRGTGIIVTYTLFLLVLLVSGRFLAPQLLSEFNRIVKELPHMMVVAENEWIAPLEQDLNAWMAEFAPTPPLEEAVLDLDPAPENDAPNGADLAADTPDVEREPWQVLVEDYSYVVRELEDGRFEISPKRRESAGGEKETVVVPHNPITASFGQLREIFEANFFELIKIGRRQLSTVLGSFFTTFLVFMLSAFILADPDRIWSFIRALIPAQYQGEFHDLLERLDHGLTGVVRGQLMICAVNGALTGIGLMVLQVPFAITLTIIATVFSLIPIFGVLISSVPIVLMASSISATTALLSVAWILVIHFLEGNFLNPKILGDAARIHPVLIVFALLVGQYSAGIVGALIAVPIFSLVQSSFLFLKNLAETLEARS